MTRDAYHGCKPLLHRLAFRHGSRFGVDPDDAYGDACLGFVQAVATFDLGRGNKFSTWVYWKVRAAVQAGADKNRPRLPLDRDVPAEAVPQRESFLPGLLRDLSDDARLAVGLLLDDDPDADEPDTVRAKLARTLLNMGWAVGRVARTFAEIKEALR